MRKFAFVLLAIAVLFAGPAFAEVQNVKVGGDITARFVKTGTLDLDDDIVGVATATDHFFMTTTRVYIEADLTDNVSTMIRFINERDWDAATNVANNNSGASDEGDIQIDLSYIKLSEFLYAPLTLIIGRQEIVWGSGLVVADGTPNSVLDNAAGPVVNALNLRNRYYSSRKSFDAVRAILDYDPWAIDVFFAKIDEDQGGVGTDNEHDEDLMGVNVSYLWANEILTEAYYVGNFDRDTATVGVLAPEVHTIGIRAEGPINALDENLAFEIELAKQWGDYSSTVDIDTWAFIVGGSYAFDNEYAPIVGLKYDYRSGNDTSSDYEGWYAQYGSYTVGNIIDKVWTNADYQTVATPRGAGGNIHAITASGSFLPLEDIELSLDWIYALADEEQLGTLDDEIGHEVIGTVTYDYTEDVTIAFMGSWFDPGDAFLAAEDDDAYELVGSVSVEF